MINLQSIKYPFSHKNFDGNIRTNIEYIEYYEY